KVSKPPVIPCGGSVYSSSGDAKVVRRCVRSREAKSGRIGCGVDCGPYGGRGMPRLHFRDEIADVIGNRYRVLQQQKVTQSRKLRVLGLRHLLRQGAAHLDIGDGGAVGPDELDALGSLEGADPAVAVDVALAHVDRQRGQPWIAF